VADSGGRDFFISYTGVNRSWAEWIAVQLEAAGYTTLLQAWDFRPGSDFLHEMQQATSSAGRTIAVLSPAYLASPYGTDEWTGAFLHDKDREGRLLPVRIEACALPRLLATRVHRPGRAGPPCRPRSGRGCMPLPQATTSWCHAGW
jgi:hypothetical protein